jgi:PIN domain nuclease of toxin-antitoxin system
LKYLLDTHTCIWTLLDHPRLGRRARTIVSGSRTPKPLGLAAISLKEAAWLLARGRVAVSEPTRWSDWLREAAAAPDIEVLPLTVDIAIESEQLPEAFPADPADRLIAATAKVHGLVLLTADRAVRASRAVATTW